MDKKIAIIGIILKDRSGTAVEVNNILSSFGNLIVGRLGIPYKEKGISVISIIVDATNDEVGAISGKLGNIEGVTAKVINVS